MIVHCEQNMKEEDQQDATIRCLILTSVSTCFGHHYAHLQETKGPITAFGVLFCNKRENIDISREVFFLCSKPSWEFVCSRMSCVIGCVVMLDWYLPRMFSGLVYRGRVFWCMRCACFMGVCGAGVIRCY